MTRETIYRSRVAAGRELASYLGTYAGMRPVVLGASEGGAVVAAEVARALDAPLVVRSNGSRPADGAGSAEALEVRGRTVIVVDDAVLGNDAARDALSFARSRGARRLVISAPVARDACLDALRPFTDEVVCPRRETRFTHAHECYDVNDDVASARDSEVPPSRPSVRVLDIRIPVGESWLEGTLVVPPEARGLVLFAHGGHSTRDSTRDRYVAGELQGAGFATMLFDLLTREERVLVTHEERALDARTVASRDDIALRAERLLIATDWIVGQPSSSPLPIGYFGSSAGAATALVAAAKRPDLVQAVVAPGGLLGHAAHLLARVRAPALLIVGENDARGVELSRNALTQLDGRSKMNIIAHAGHSFDEPGALESVAAAAASWFTEHLVNERQEQARARRPHELRTILP